MTTMTAVRIDKREARRRFNAGELIAVSTTGDHDEIDNWHSQADGYFATFADIEQLNTDSVPVGTRIYWYAPRAGRPLCRLCNEPLGTLSRGHATKPYDEPYKHTAQPYETCATCGTGVDYDGYDETGTMHGSKTWRASDACHAVLDAAWHVAFDALRAAGLEADDADPIAAHYRAASDAVNHANRSRDFDIFHGPTAEVAPTAYDPNDYTVHPAYADGTYDGPVGPVPYTAPCGTGFYTADDASAHQGHCDQCAGVLEPIMRHHARALEACMKRHPASQSVKS